MVYIKDGCSCTSTEQVEGQTCLNYPFLQMTRTGWLIWLHLIYDPSKHVPFFKNPSFGSHLLHQDVHLVNCCLIRNYIANKSKYDVAYPCFCSKTPVAPHIWFKKAKSNNSQNIELRASKWVLKPMVEETESSHVHKNRHEAVMEITAWASKITQISVSMNTVHPAILRIRLKFCQNEEEANMIQNTSLYFELQLIYTDWGKVWDKSKFIILFGKHGCCILWTEEVGDHPACYQHPV